MTTKNLVSLANVRQEWKEISGTPCAVVKKIYAIAAEEESAETLRGILPAKRQECINLIPTICDLYNVGKTRTIKRADGNEYTYTIKFSADMLFRFLCGLINHAHKENTKKANAEKRAAEKAKRDAEKARKQAEKEQARKEKEQKRAERNAVNAARIEEEKREAEKEAKKRAKQAEKKQAKKANKK